MENRKPRCHNCKHAGKQFKILALTHLHCEDSKQYPKEKFENGDFCAWDTLRVFSNTCKHHEVNKKKS